MPSAGEQPVPALCAACLLPVRQGTLGRAGHAAQAGVAGVGEDVRVRLLVARDWVGARGALGDPGLKPSAVQTGPPG